MLVMSVYKPVESKREKKKLPYSGKQDIQNLIVVLFQ